MARRRQAFQEFVRGIPRICSPSLITCSTVPLCDTSPQSLDPSYRFDWSIDQMAALHPADFSTELNASFYQLDESVDEVIRDENSQYFNQSRVLPSPETDVADSRNRSSFDPSPCAFSMSTQSTPSRGFGDMSVSETKLPTPVNVAKSRQTKKKLFSDDSLMSEMLTEPSTNDSDAFRSDSITAMQLLDQSMPEMSPIVGESSRVLEMGAMDETFANESMQVTGVTGSCISGRRRAAAFDMHHFTFKTSTPTTSHS